MMRFRLGLLSDVQIRERSQGEVFTEQLFQRGEPVAGGLFCQRIFGPLRDYQCKCGKLNGLDHKGKTCRECGVLVTSSRIRWNRSGHIELGCTVVHPLAVRLLAGLLDIPLLTLQRFLLTKIWGCWKEDPKGMLVAKGGRRVRFALSETPIPGSFLSSEGLYRSLSSVRVSPKAARSLRLLQERWRPSACFLSCIPVLSPMYRPTYINAHRHFIHHDFTQGYVRVLLAKERLAHLPLPRLTTLRSLHTILIQRAVFTLFTGKPEVKKRTGQPLKGILETLAGKRGFIRRHMFGKRVDYSGRSVIAADPTLPLDAVGLPEEMAFELFLPHIIALLRREYKLRYRECERLVRARTPEARDALARLIPHQIVCLNRQPTLHRMGFMAFKPRLHTRKNVTLSALVTTPYNYDADGDQMAVHVPLSAEAHEEAWRLMRADRNLLSALNSTPLVLPSHEMVLGLAAMTRLDPGSPRPARASQLDTLLQHGAITYATTLLVEGQVTSAGRLLVGEQLGVPIEHELTKDVLGQYISRAYDVLGPTRLGRALDILKTLSLAQVTTQGFSLGLADLSPPRHRDERFGAAQIATADPQMPEARRLLCWHETFTTLSQEFVDEQGPNNALVRMLASGARVSRQQINQLVVAKGLQARADGRVNPHPVLHALRDGLSPHEYFQTFSGARKSMADKKNATPLAGYIAQKLVHLLRDFYIVRDDCGYAEAQYLQVPARVARGRSTVEGTVIPWTTTSAELVAVRSPIFCQAPDGLCQACYGADPTTRGRVRQGTAVGIVTAQALSEPGTQLSLRSFHTSGHATVKDTTVRLTMPEAGTLVVHPPDGLFRTLVINQTYRYYVAAVQGRVPFGVGSHVLGGGEVIAEYPLDVQNRDMAGKLPLLLRFLEGSTSAPALIAPDDGVVTITRERQRLVVAVNGKPLGSVPPERPLLVADQMFVRQGTFLSSGELNVLALEGNLPLAAQLYSQHLRDLYTEEGIEPLAIHCEMVFRGLSELVQQPDGTFGLYRLQTSGKRRILGLQQVLRQYPSWMKPLAFGYVRHHLERAIRQGLVSEDLPTERLMYAKFPLHDSQHFQL